MLFESKIIDVDVHNQLKSPKDLLPYLPEPWESRVASSGIGMPGRGYSSPVGVLRQDCLPPTGGPAASDPDFLVKDLIEPFQIEYAILTGSLIDVTTMHDPDHAAVIASAYNDFLVAEWLPKHESFRGSIVVGAHNQSRMRRRIREISEFKVRLPGGRDCLAAPPDVASG
jgi:hypothetical protein